MSGGASTAKRAFALGLASGVVLVVKWRPLLKQGIRTGMQANALFQQASVKAMENVVDLAYEVRSEMASDGQPENAAGSSETVVDGTGPQGNGKTRHRDKQSPVMN